MGKKAITVTQYSFDCPAVRQLGRTLWEKKRGSPPHPSRCCHDAITESQFPRFPFQENSSPSLSREYSAGVETARSRKRVITRVSSQPWHRRPTHFQTLPVQCGGGEAGGRGEEILRALVTAPSLKIYVIGFMWHAYTRRLQRPMIGQWMRNNSWNCFVAIKITLL